MNEKIKDFYTIEIQEFSFSRQRLIDKKIEMFFWEYFPPTIYSVLWKNWKPIPKWSIGFELKEASETIKEKFAKNISIQKEIIEIIKTRNENYWYQCWMIKLETWMWKWNLATQIVNYFQQPTLILVSNKKLQAEMIERFEEFSNTSPSQYWWGKKNIENITVCTKQSFLKDYESFSHFKVVIVDEMHQGFTEKFMQWINKCFHKQKIAFYGMSWTTYTQDLKSEHMEKYYWKVIDLNIWYDIIPKFTFLNYHNSKQYEFEQFHELKEELLDDSERYKYQKKELEKIMKKNKYTLILSDRISEIEKYYNDYKDKKDIYVIMISWETKIEQDEESLQKAKDSWKNILIVWSIAKVGTGFNFPILDSIFLIPTIKFKAQTIQAVWRILRQCEWKTEVNAYIWNDKILEKQKKEKEKTIKIEYWLSKDDIIQIDINKREAVLWELHIF